MKKSILKSKIKRKNLKEHLGNYFRDDNSEIVKNLNDEGKKALFGIQREDGIYTIICENLVCFSTISGRKNEISIEDFEKRIHLNAAEKGKTAKFDFLRINEEENLWLYDRLTMEAFWNIVIWMLKQ